MAYPADWLLGRVPIVERYRTSAGGPVVFYVMSPANEKRSDPKK